MRQHTKARSWGWALAPLVFPAVLPAQAQDPKSIDMPASTLQSFYHSYLTLIGDSKDPFKTDRDLMNRYVDKSLLVKLGKRASPDEDYFTKSQDILDDWTDHIVVASRKCPETTCHMQVVLGLSKAPSYKIDVEVKKDRDGWKITKVTKPVIDR